MFIRFVVKRLDPDSGRRQGLFQAADELRGLGDLSSQDHEILDNLFEWFRLNLRTPSRLSVSRRPHSKAQAISWFKLTAHKHIAKMREFQRVLEPHGVVIETIKARRPGYIVYEDEFQVAAYPFSDTPT